MRTTSYPHANRLQGDNIRLIKIQPGEWSDPIRCNLLNSCLSEARPYHALSYVWGSNKVTRSIFLDGHIIYTTVNLESALRHLRHQLKDVLLWIDALCINQSDDDERTHQVGIMGSIYKSCQSVLVYLGDGVGRRQRIKQSGPQPITFVEPTTNSVFQSTEASLKDDTALDGFNSDTLKVFYFIQMLSRTGHLNELANFQTGAIPDVSQSTLSLFETLRQLTHAPFMPWWTRIWVVQEVVFPPQVTLICGTISAPWKMFAQAASRYSRHSQQCCASIAGALPRDSTNVLRGFCRLVLDLEHMRQANLSVDNTIDSSFTNAQNSRSLLPLLRRFRNRKSSEPRDKVYALLSLVETKDDQDKIQPDYSLSEKEVFKLAALTSIRSSASLSVLHTDLARKYRHDLPSWVPDWEAPGDMNDNFVPNRIDLYDTCTSYPVNENTVDCSKDALFLDIKTVGSILETTPVMFSEEPDSVRATLGKWLPRYLSFEAYVSISPGTPEHFMVEGRVESGFIPVTKWCKLLCADIITYPGGPARRARHEDEIMFKNWFEFSQLSPRLKKGSLPLSAPVADQSGPQPRVADELHSSDALRDENAAVLTSGINLWQDEVAGINHPWPLLVLFEELVVAMEPQGIMRERIGIAARIVMSERIGIVLKKLFPVEEMRMLLIMEALKENITTPWNFDPSYVHKIMPQIIQSNKESGEAAHALRSLKQCWDILPWASILEKARPYVWKTLRTETRTEQIPVSQQVAIMDHSITLANKSRCLFITDGHCMGLGPAAVQKGDNLCLLKGGQTPFILRDKEHLHVTQATDDGGNTAGCYVHPLSDGAQFQINKHKSKGAAILKRPIKAYELIGDCYADGLMDSETLEDGLEDIWQKQPLLYRPASRPGWGTCALV